MKNILTILFCLTLSLGAMAQGATAGVFSFTRTIGSTTTNDTLTASGGVGTTKYLYTPQVKAGNGNATIQLVATRVSGTAGGTVTMEGSLDGTNWDTLANTSYTITNTASQNHIYDITDQKRLYYRLKFVADTAAKAVRITALYQNR